MVTMTVTLTERGILYPDDGAITAAADHNVDANV